MRYWTNSRGQLHQSGSHGTYRVNNGDPQCDVNWEEEGIDDPNADPPTPERSDQGRIG